MKIGREILKVPSLEAFLSPTSCKNDFSEPTKERSFFEVSYRLIWHLLFDHCHQVRKLYGNNKLIFEKFLDEIYEKKISIDWKLHLYFLHYLEKQDFSKEKFPQDLSSELMICSVQKWVQNDKTMTEGMAIFCTERNVGFLGKKTRTVKDSKNFFKIAVNDKFIDKLGMYYSETQDRKYINWTFFKNEFQN